jgi:hypothetical protein
MTALAYIASYAALGCATAWLVALIIRRGRS